MGIFTSDEVEAFKGALESLRPSVSDDAAGEIAALQLYLGQALRTKI